MRTFPNGSVRDDLGDKPRLELVPYDLIMNRLGKVLTDGAEHYGANNFRKGQPQSSTFGSLMRHLTKWSMGMTDEDHLAKALFNVISLLNADEYFKNDPLVCDMQDWYKDGKPTGAGTYEEKSNKNI